MYTQAIIPSETKPMPTRCQETWPQWPRSWPDQQNLTQLIWLKYVLVGIQVRCLYYMFLLYVSYSSCCCCCCCCCNCEFIVFLPDWHHLTTGWLSFNHHWAKTHPYPALSPSNSKNTPCTLSSANPHQPTICRHETLLIASGGTILEHKLKPKARTSPIAMRTVTRPTDSKESCGIRRKWSMKWVKWCLGDLKLERW